MKASYRRTKKGYMPIVIIDNNIRYTIKSEFLLKRHALQYAEELIEERLKLDLFPEQESFDKN